MGILGTVFRSLVPAALWAAGIAVGVVCSHLFGRPAWSVAVGSIVGLLLTIPIIWTLERRRRVIETVYCLANGMTMAFDKCGEWMPEYQGRTDEVLPRIRAAGWKGEPFRTVWPECRFEEKA